MMEFGPRLVRSMGIMSRMVPILLYRCGLYLLAGAGAFSLLLTLHVIHTRLERIADVLGGLFAFVSIVGLLYLVYKGTEFFLRVKAGEVAVLTELLARGSLPYGAEQVSFARAAVDGRFGDGERLWNVNRRIRHSVTSFNVTLRKLVALVPVPGLEAPVGIVVQLATSLVDEAVLSRIFLRSDQDVWTSCREGIILYAQFAKVILPMAAFLAVLEWAVAAAAFVMVLLLVVTPAGAILPGLLRFCAPFVAACVVRFGVLQPLGVTAVTLTFHELSHGAEIDPQVEATLQGMSWFSQLRSGGAIL